jgi:high-affinity iron transporter
MGQEVFNATILFAAVGMLGWHNVWMGRHGKEMAMEAKALGRDVASGARPLYALALVVGIAVLREGSEVVLFLYGLAAAGGGGVVNMVGGGAIGLVGGAIMGAGLYLGLLRIPTRHLFAVTSWMILLLAAGLAAQGAAFLTQADVLPALGNQIWDTSWLLTDDSVLGRILHILVGYVARPAGIQLLFWAATLIVLLSLMRWFSTAPARTVTRAAAIVVLAAAGLGIAGTARADFTIHPPIVEYKEFEVEHNGSYTFDPDPSKKHNETGTLEIGYGFLPWWGTEVEFAWSRTSIRRDASTRSTGRTPSSSRTRASIGSTPGSSRRSANPPASATRITWRSARPCRRNSDPPSTSSTSSSSTPSVLTTTRRASISITPGSRSGP